MTARLPAEAVSEVGVHTQPPRRTLLQRLRAWWHLRQLHHRLEALTVLHWQAENDLDNLRAKKRAAGWAKTPTLDARIREAQHALDKAAAELAAVDKQIEQLHPNTQTNT